MTPKTETVNQQERRKCSKSSNDESSLKHTEGPPWADLPYTVLVDVYKHLTDDEKSNASKTCKNWRTAFQDPALWRVRQFDFGGPRANCSGIKAVQFVNRHGQFLQEVTIRCTHFTSNTCETIARRLEPFLQRLQRARLKTLRIKYLELDRFWRYAHLRVKISQWFVAFIETQGHLQELDVTCCQFDLLPGVEVLQALAGAVGSNLRYLYLEDFFHSRLDVIQLPVYVNTIKRFDQLVELSLNYCCINDDIVLHWSQNMKSVLTKMTIKVVQNEPHNHTIANKSWSKLRLACPQLSVDLDVSNVGPSALVVPLLPPAMPLIRFRYRTGFDDEMELRLSRTFLHLAAHFGRNLLELDLDIDNLQDNVNESLVTLVSKCVALEYVYIRAIINVQTADTICRLLLQKRSRVKHIDIIVREMTYEDTEELRLVRRQLMPIAEERDIQLNLEDALFE